jgi:hypothetical protein
VRSTGWHLVDDQTPSGTLDHSNAKFTLASRPHSRADSMVSRERVPPFPAAQTSWLPAAGITRTG